jgi:kynureninase
VHGGIAAPGSPAVGATGVGADHSADDQVGGWEGIRIAERAQRDVVDGPRPDARQREQLASHLVAVRERVERDVAVRHGLCQRAKRALSGTREPDRGELGAGDSFRSRECVRERAASSFERFAALFDEPARERSCGSHGHLLAEHGAHRELETIDGPGHPQSWVLRDAGCEHRIGAERLVDRDRISVEVEQPPAASNRVSHGAQILDIDCRDDMARLWPRPQLDDSTGEHAAIAIVLDFFDTFDASAGEPLQQRTGCERRSEGESQGQRADGLAGCGCPTSKLARHATELRAHHVVELPDAGKPCAEGDRRQWQRRVLDEHARGLRSSGAGQREGTDTDLTDKHSMQVPLADGEPLGEAGHSVGVDDAAFDPAQRSGSEVGADIPLAAARGGVGPAPLAGAEAGSRGCRRPREEQHVFALRRLRGAGGAAVDARRADRSDEPAVESRVPAAHRAITAVEVLVHMSIMRLAQSAGWRFSDALAIGGRRDPNAYGGSVHEDLLARRSDYPILDRCTYLINNSLGAMHRETRTRLTEFADLWDSRGVMAWDDWFPEMTRVADLVGTVIGAPAGSTVLRANVADAITAVASCFDLGGQRGRIVTTAADWPGTHYFWTEQCRRAGGELVVVPFEDDGITVRTDRIVDAIDERTLIVSVSLVQFRTSAVLDIEPVVAAAHAHGAVVLLDAYQAVGCLPVDVARRDVDFCLGGSVKFLWLYVKPELAATLRPAAVGWISHEAPFAFDWDDIRYAPGVMRFAGGTPNVPAAYAAAPGYQAIVDIGIERVRQRSVSLTQPLLESAIEAGLTVRSPLAPERRGGHVTIDPGDAERVHKELIARGFIVDYRPGSGIRVAPHFYNTADECTAIVAEMAALRP